MTNDRKDELLEDGALDDLFAEVRADKAVPPAGLNARILADAQAHVTARAATMMKDAPAGGWFQRLFGPLGGARGAAGLALAGCAGVMLGYLDMSTISGAVEVLGLEIGAYDYGDFYASFTGFAEEG